MLSIREEIRAIEDGRVAVADSALRHAPHTARDLLASDWNRPYERAVGCFPGGMHGDKYFPPVGRLDNSYGDRNLVCSCPPIDSYAEAAD